MRRILAAACGAVIAAAGLASASVRVESDTILRAFERDTPEADDELVMPAYEYLALAVEDMAGGTLSFYGGGWGRYQFGGQFYEDDVEGELFHAYLQYASSGGGVTARLGRVPIGGPLGVEPVDGAFLAWRPLGILALSAYGGLPVGVSDTAGRSGDATAGARLEHAFGRWYTAALSYQYLENDGEENESSGALDFVVRPHAHLNLRGLSVYNFTADDWAEHAYALRLHWPGFHVEPFYQRIDYEGFFETGDNTGSPFRLLGATDDRLTLYGVTAGARLDAKLEVGLSLRQYLHDETEADALYGGIEADFTPAKDWRLGAAGGRMDGDAADNRYTLGRIWAEYAPTRGSVSVEGLYVGYDEPVLGEDASLYAAASGALRFLQRSLTVRLTGEYSEDPYFSEDVRGMLTISYGYGR